MIKKYKQYIKENIDFDEEWEDEEEEPIPADFIGHEDFYNFLVDNDALDKWIKNTINNHNPVKDFLGGVSIINYLNRCFGWSSTPEGRLYWERLNKKWQIPFYSSVKNRERYG